ncbi:MBL fold metallo-hydrolase [Enterococcus hirae]|uniref:Metallo-beta-lactamase superfamily protein n=2 Tax=Enterococcus hirae TaxID=1354 RepID=I6SFH4_ENTHA|nr:MBL fold metallo-hydrolase [Enterococcus hirae]AFM71403.1 metallo-beta-lactamase superfamily protein [Enterococcus hirae ATCC 9790]EOH71256.1 metallo-beta-lactamase [Enterococcus hirae ATCC 9790]EOU07784.1 metallo-beta-lactamase [Enterococcus hirae ATCC 9790]MBA5281435.1 MBL fold metallo-hydrolase [Enterococcus hirae]OJG51073.1 metallo-beta-lactamase superfamily protein [Enterococcus hirae]
MHIEQIKTGMIEENCYLVYNDEALLIIDPGEDAAKIKTQIEKTQQQPVAILLTHTHYDHIGAVEELRQFYQIPVYVSPLEQSWLGDPILNLSGLGRHDDIANIIVSPAEYEFEMKPYRLGNMTFRVVPTPGHSIGSVSFIFDDFVVSGDALFKGSIGRTDLYTGNLEKLLHSIQTQLFVLPDEFAVYPGHGDATTIEHEKRTNPFFNA